MCGCVTVPAYFYKKTLDISFEEVIIYSELLREGGVMGDKDERQINIVLLIFLIAVLAVGFFLKHIFSPNEAIKPEQAQQETRRE